MAQAIIMPRQGISVESCIITSWHKSVGDKVNIGDVLFSYETDKASFEEEATVQGIMLAILREEDDDVPCLENVCVIGQEGEDISEFTSGLRDAQKQDEVTESSEKVEAIEEIVEAPKAIANSDGRVFISPRAKNLAEKSNADISKATASGPNNRIIERDVEALIKAGIKTNNLIDEKEKGAKTSPTAGVVETKYEDVKLTNIRKIIAKAMHASLTNTAQLTLNAAFDATQIMKYRSQVKASGEALGTNNITINDIILYATAKTLKKHKDLNAHFMDTYMRLFSDVNLGIAVDTDRGLLVPTLFGADKLSLNDLSSCAKDLISRARSSSINPDMLTGGTFTVTNLGTLGVESFTPVINPPQTGILGVCAIVDRVKIVNGEIKSYKAMGLSLTFDHRAVDGAPAARFLKDLCTALENFNLTLAI